MTAKQKKKLGKLGILIMVVAAIITGSVFAYTALSAGVFVAGDTKISKEDQAKIDQTWGGKAPSAAEEKKIVDQVLNQPWPPPNPFLTAPVVPVPVVVPPSVRSDFKVEYKVIGPAAKEVEIKSVPSNDPTMVSHWYITKTNKPLQITRSINYLGSSGNTLYSLSTNWGIVQGNPGEKIRGGNDSIREGAQKLIILLEVEYAK